VLKEVDTLAVTVSVIVSLFGRNTHDVLWSVGLRVTSQLVVHVGTADVVVDEFCFDVEYSGDPVVDETDKVLLVIVHWEDVVEFDHATRMWLSKVLLRTGFEFVKNAKPRSVVSYGLLDVLLCTAVVGDSCCEELGFNRFASSESSVVILEVTGGSLRIVLRGICCVKVVCGVSTSTESRPFVLVGIANVIDGDDEPDLSTSEPEMPVKLPPSVNPIAASVFYSIREILRPRIYKPT